MNNTKVVTKAGKTFVEMTNKAYENSKEILATSGYRLATEEEVARFTNVESVEDSPTVKKKKTKASIS